MSRLTLVGLGPGDPALLTHAAAEALANAPYVAAADRQHPALAHLPPGAVRPLTRDDLDHDGPLLIALPGDPGDYPFTAALLARGARLLPGVSIVSACCTALGIAGPGSGLQTIAAADLLCGAPGLADVSYSAEQAPWSEITGAGAYTPPLWPYPLTPARPTLVMMDGGQWTVDSDHRSSSTACPEPHRGSHRLKELLLLRYPAVHPVRLVQLDVMGGAALLWEGLLGELDAGELRAGALFLPALEPLDDRRGLDGLAYVVARLLGPHGCPWDRRQSHQSLRSALLEEAHEVLEALDAGDMAALPDELGDLLLQVIVHSEMARQAGGFDLGEVLTHITTKLIRRHPHVFGDTAVAGTGEVVANWEQIKARELAEKGRTRASVLDGVPAGLPALAAAQKLGNKAARTGFNWSALAGVWEKLHEELAELEEASASGDRSHAVEEFGDLLFVLTRLASWLEIDAEAAMREANAKFRRRFGAVEQAARAQGRELHEMTLEEMRALWQEVKKG